MDKIIYTGNEDWICDRCGKPESEVGELRSGRLSSGWDYQLCENCFHDGIKEIQENEA